MAKRKPKNLKDIKVNEVSFVDSPANKLPFLFFKNKSSNQINELGKQKKIKVGIESDGTAKGTTVTLNGKKLNELRSFDFSFYGNSPNDNVHCSYSEVVESENGFKRAETFFLSKGDMMKKELLKALQDYEGKEDIDFEKKVNEEEVEKAISLISEHYKESFPEDLEKAVGVLAKSAACSFEAAKEEKEDVAKAGAKFSSATAGKIRSIIDSLKALLPDAESTKKSESGNDDSALAKQVAELSEVLSKLEKPQKSEEKESKNEDLAKALKDISDRLNKLETDGAVKKSVDGQEDDDDSSSNDGDNKHKWPSLSKRVAEE